MKKYKNFLLKEKQCTFLNQKKFFCLKVFQAFSHTYVMKNINIFGKNDKGMNIILMFVKNSYFPSQKLVSEWSFCLFSQNLFIRYF